LNWTLSALKFIGIGAGTGAAAAAMKELIKKPNSLEWQTGVKTLLTRLGGQGAIFEGMIARYGMSAAALQPAVLAIVLIGTAMYESFKEQMERITLILLDRLQNGQMSNETFFSDLQRRSQSG
jgi:uridine phosphorylase